MERVFYVEADEASFDRLADARAYASQIGAADIREELWQSGCLVAVRYY